MCFQNSLFSGESGKRKKKKKSAHALKRCNYFSSSLFASVTLVKKWKLLYHFISMNGFQWTLHYPFPDCFLPSLTPTLASPSAWKRLIGAHHPLHFTCTVCLCPATAREWGKLRKECESGKFQTWPLTGMARPSWLDWAVSNRSCWQYTLSWVFILNKLFIYLFILTFRWLGKSPLNHIWNHLCLLLPFLKRIFFCTCHIWKCNFIVQSF